MVSEHYNNQIGAYIPKSFIYSSEIEYSPKMVAFYPQNKFTIKSVVNALSVKSSPKDDTFVALPSTSVYAPIVYLPQSIGILIGRILKFSPLMLMYLGRIFNLIF